MAMCYMLAICVWGANVNVKFLTLYFNYALQEGISGIARRAEADRIVSDDLACCI